MNGTKLHVQYSDGSGKDMDMPPATSLRLPYNGQQPNAYVIINEAHYGTGHYMTLSGTWHYPGEWKNGFGWELTGSSS